MPLLLDNHGTPLAVSTSPIMRKPSQRTKKRMTDESHQIETRVPRLAYSIKVGYFIGKSQKITSAGFHEASCPDIGINKSDAISRISNSHVIGRISSSATHTTSPSVI